MMGGYATAQAAQAQHVASHLQAPHGPPPSSNPDSGAPPARARAACLITTLHNLPARRGGWSTAQAAQAKLAAPHLQAPPGPPPSPTPDSSAPSPACPAQRAPAPPAPPPPCTPCQRGWVGGALHKQPWHSRKHHICRHPLVHRRRRPPTAAHPLPPAQRSARTRRLLHHHPAHPASEAGWVGHCTSSPGTAGSITSAGTPRCTAVADPRRQRTLSRLPSAGRARAACSTTTLHTLPARLGGWDAAQAAQETAWQRAAFATAGGVAAAAASPWLQLQPSCLQSTSSSVTYATREQCQSGLRTRRAHCSRCHLARGWRRPPAGAF